MAKVRNNKDEKPSDSASTDRLTFAETWNRISPINRVSIIGILLLKFMLLSNMVTLGREAIPIFRDIKDLFLVSIISPEIAVSDVLAMIMSVCVIIIPSITFHWWFSLGFLSDYREFLRNNTKRLALIIGLVVFWGIFETERYTFSQAEIRAISKIKSCDPATNRFCGAKKQQEDLKKAKKRLAEADKYALILAIMTLTIGGIAALVVERVKSDIENKE